MVLGPLIETGVNWLAGRDVAKRQADANQADIAASAANQEKSLQALTGETPFSKTTRNPEGGFDIDYGPKGIAANEAFRKMAVGDVARADRFNEAGNQVDTFSSIGDAKNFLAQDTNTARRNFMDQIHNLTERDRQLGTGIPSTNDLGRLAGKLAPAYRQFETADVDALNLFNQQGTADRAKIADIQNLNRPQAPAPAFTDKTPGNIAAQAIYSTPPPSTIPDVSGAVGYKAVGNYLANQRIADANALANQQYWKHQNRLIDALANRQLGNEVA